MTFKSMKTLVLTLLMLATSFFAAAQPFSSEKTNEGIWVLDNGEKVFFYQTQTKSLNGAYPRANYVHPLYLPGGLEITEDFPADHLHHRGIFWAWHQVVVDDRELGDAWECRDFVWDVQQAEAKPNDKGQIDLQSKVIWKSPHLKDNHGEYIPIVEENVTITAHIAKENYRVIDFQIAIRALEKNLKIGGSKDEKGYGGFSVRVKMPEDIMFFSSDGSVEPKINQVEAGSWMNITGSMLSDGRPAGVMIINHKDNPMFPEKWILRKARSMQNPVFPGRELFEISNEKPLILKYRLVVYSGALKEPQIHSLEKAYQK